LFWNFRLKHVEILFDPASLGLATTSGLGSASTTDDFAEGTWSKLGKACWTSQALETLEFANKHEQT
jgi:hypothetical protein